MGNFKIGHSIHTSETYFLNGVQDNEGHFWCDTPGYNDTNGATTAIAHAIAMTDAFRFSTLLKIVQIDWEKRLENELEVYLLGEKTRKLNNKNDEKTNGNNLNNSMGKLQIEII